MNNQNQNHRNFETGRQTADRLLIAVFLIFLVLCISTALCHAQNAPKQAKQTLNGTVITDTKARNRPDKVTAYTYLHNGKSLPVYESARGKFYCLITSKTGSTYKKYLSF